MAVAFFGPALPCECFLRGFDCHAGAGRPSAIRFVSAVTAANSLRSDRVEGRGESGSAVADTILGGRFRLAL